jgi:stage V sporulation protein SpoVS
MLTQKLLGATAVAAPTTLQFGAGATDTSNLTTYTFSSHAIGSAAANRYVVVLVLARAAGTDSGVTCTVGGQSCSAVGGGPFATGAITAFPYLFITDAPVTTGTTASVIVTYPTTGASCRISTYALYTTNSTPNHTDAVTGANPQTINSPLASGEVGITMGFPTTTSSLTSISVSGPVTQDYNSGIAESSGILTATLTGSGTVTFSTVGTGSVARAILATWS